jgi:hypothetical protein
MVRKIRNSNTGFSSDTDHLKIPKGTTNERVAPDDTITSGEIRFNTSLAALEYYNGSGWVVLDATPAVTSINPSSILLDGSTTTEITITGANFTPASVVTLISDDGINTITPSVVTFVNSTTLTFTCGSGQLEAVSGIGESFNLAKDPYDVVVTSLSGNKGTLSNALSTNAKVYFVTASGNLTNTFSANRTVNATVEARDPESTAITYALASGSLPGGVTLNTSTGVISGTDTNPGSVTTYNFSISASDGIHTSVRDFNIVSYPATVETFNSDGTFTVPNGLTSVSVLVVAGGGGGSGQCGIGSGGGAGGLIFRPGLPITPGTPIAVTVGGAGSSTWTGPDDPASAGGNSVFSTLTAVGGGGGGAFSSGRPGGSGGGGGVRACGQGTHSAGTGIQPAQPGESGSFGFGNPGGPVHPGNRGAGGGGGAGAAGQAGAQNNAGDGGAGRTYSISGSPVIYAGGGGASGTSSPGVGGPGGGGGFQTAGTANRGGGGGGQAAGGTGVVIVSY